VSFAPKVYFDLKVPFLKLRFYFIGDTILELKTKDKNSSDVDY